ncbi:MAG TPA: sialidase family protein [Anaeromyxobacteraceae bacterium]|nr:sialidase family protein [Anaeromyxobacteraceae bacterium]
MNARPAVALAAVLAAGSTFAAPRAATEKPGPQKSGFYDLYTLAAESPGIGQVVTNACTISAATQPPVYAGNMLLDCDGEVPHNETAIVVNPADPDHAVGGYHSYQIHFLGATVVSHVVGTVSVTFDGGGSWREVTPPVTPYQFTGDPALAFGAGGRLWFANIADHEGPGGWFTAPSVVVATSDDGGLTWTNPVTVASGMGAVSAGYSGGLVFQDKEFIAADAFAASPFAGRAYVTWTSFQERYLPVGSAFRSPITASWSDDGASWSAPREISGFGEFCSAAYQGKPHECDLNQDSYPTVAPNGRVYVSFENFNTPAENQILVVRSDDGGRSFSPPVKVTDVFDIDYPQNTDGRDTLTGCNMRVSSVANSAADPSDASGNTVYVVWSDNRNGSEEATNTDVFLARSTDGGATWSTIAVDRAANDQFYPWVSVGKDGRVDVGYMDRFPSAGQLECKYGFTLTRLRLAADGTVAWRTTERVDTGLSHADQSRWFGQNARFVGDYNGVAVGPDGSTWSLWTDMRAEIENPPAPNRNHGQHAVGTRTPAP